jgi:hypothetical protein
MLIASEDFTNQGLFEVYHDAQVEVEMDDDGNIRIVYDGVKLRASFDSDRNFLFINCWWSLKPGFNRAKVLEFCNRFNDRLVMVRCSYPERLGAASSIYLDYVAVTDGGVTTEEILKATSRFVGVVSVIREHDVDCLLA